MKPTALAAVITLAAAATLIRPGGLVAPQGADVPAASHALRHLGIAAVNGAGGRVLGAAGAPLHVSGRGFGATPGRAVLVTKPGQAALPLDVTAWRDDVIEGAIPGASQSLPGEAAALLLVKTAMGRSYLFDAVTLVRHVAD